MAKIKKSFTLKLLKVLAIGGAIAVASSSPYFGLNIIKGIERDLKRKKWKEFYRDLYKLRRSKRINTFQNPDGTYTVELTNIGKSYLAKYDLDDLKVEKPKEWDGQWRFLAFDIPAVKKNARQALLSKLKELGFIMVQKSLWAHPYECREELAVIAKAFEVEPYVSAFLASDIDSDWVLKKKFYDKNNIKLDVLR